MLTFTEENYLKAILKICFDHNVVKVGTNELALQLSVKPATVNDMLKRLKEKKLVNYEKYGKIKLTAQGRRSGLEIFRNHRLWETFLYEKLGFGWDEIHEIAEQLEHIKSPKLIDKLEEFLQFPEFDPHGDPIPNRNGEMRTLYKKTLLEVAPGETCKLAALKDDSPSFLQYISSLGLAIYDSILVEARHEFDSSLAIKIKKREVNVSQKIAENILVQ